MAWKDVTSVVFRQVGLGGGEGFEMEVQGQGMVVFYCAVRGGPSWLGVWKGHSSKR